MPGYMRDIPGQPFFCVVMAIYTTRKEYDISLLPPTSRMTVGVWLRHR